MSSVLRCVLRCVSFDVSLSVVLRSVCCDCLVCSLDCGITRRGSQGCDVPGQSCSVCCRRIARCVGREPATRMAHAPCVELIVSSAANGKGCRHCCSNTTSPQLCPGGSVVCSEYCEAWGMLCTAQYNEEGNDDDENCKRDDKTSCTKTGSDHICVCGPGWCPSPSSLPMNRLLRISSLAISLSLSLSRFFLFSVRVCVGVRLCRCVRARVPPQFSCSR